MEVILLGYLAVAYLSLAVTVGLAQRRSGRGFALAIAMGLAGATLLMVPLFYLVYTGAMFPPWWPLGLLFPLGWAHLAIYRWVAPKGLWRRFGVSITYALSLPVLFLLVHAGVFLHARYLVTLAVWALFLTGSFPWIGRIGGRNGRTLKG